MKKVLTVRVDEKTAWEFALFCKAHDQTMSQVLRAAMRRYCSDWEEQVRKAKNQDMFTGKSGER